MEISHTFFEDEVRDGFYVPGSVKRVWAAQLKVLAEVDEVCKRHGIRWYADFGTLLGAVRHGGFIPWDDDIDICMLREDYERFHAIAKRELPERYAVLSMHTDEVLYEYHIRVVNEHGICFDDDFLRTYCECPFAVGVDVFPLDYMVSGQEEEARCTMLENLINIGDFVSEEDEESDAYREVLEQVESLCHVRFDAAKPVKQRLFEAAGYVRSMYDRKRAERLANMVYWVLQHRCRYPLTSFDETVMLPFEMLQVPAPADYAAVLEATYGESYMAASKKGACHGYPFFREQEELLIKAEGENRFYYCFRQEDLASAERLPQRALRTESQKFVGLAGRLHGLMADSLRAGNHAQYGELSDVCRKGAENIKLLTVHDYGEEHDTAAVLDEYCELLRTIQGMPAAERTGAAVDVIADCLEEMLVRLSESVEKDILGRREVVLLPWKASHWNTLADIWQAARADSRCDVYVIPVPYYEKNGDGMLTEMHYEGGAFPPEVPIVHYEEYDFVHRHPDVIITQNPYDEYNATTSVAPLFYSAYLKQYTEELVYMPWFTLDEIEDGDEKSLFMMRYFCTVPGVVHADKVPVQSERMRARYIECLTAFAGEDTREIWERKICVLSPAAVRGIVGGQEV